MYHSGVSPFGGWRHHLPPAKAVGLWVLSNGSPQSSEDSTISSSPAGEYNKKGSQNGDFEISLMK